MDAVEATLCWSIIRSCWKHGGYCTPLGSLCCLAAVAVVMVYLGNDAALMAFVELQGLRPAMGHLLLLERQAAVSHSLHMIWLAEFSLLLGASGA